MGRARDGLPAAPRPAGGVSAAPRLAGGAAARRRLHARAPPPLRATARSPAAPPLAEPGAAAAADGAAAARWRPGVAAVFSMVSCGSRTASRPRAAGWDRRPRTVAGSVPESLRAAARLLLRRSRSRALRTCPWSPARRDDEGEGGGVDRSVDDKGAGAACSPLREERANDEIIGHPVRDGPDGDDLGAKARGTNSDGTTHARSP